MSDREPPKLKPAPCCWLCRCYELSWCDKYNREVTENMICDGYDQNEDKYKRHQEYCNE